MRIRPKYITTLLVAGAAAVAIGAAPIAVAAPASAQPTGIVTAPMGHGGGHGGWGGGDHGGWGGGDHRGWGGDHGWGGDRGWDGGDYGGWQWWLPHW
jgi:hypothetical protein